MIYVIYYYSLPMQLTQVYINLYSSLLNCISLNGTYFKTKRVSDYDETVFYFSFCSETLAVDKNSGSLVKC